MGKLFEKLILDNNVENFQYTDMLRLMCVQNPTARIQSFSAVAQAIQTDRFPEIKFSDTQTEAYRKFAEAIFETISKIEYSAKYHDDIDKIKRQLADCYRSVMLEEIVPDAATVTQCFIDGVYYYRNELLQVQIVKGFLDLLQTCNTEQGKIVIANLQTKLDAIKRYSLDDSDYDYIPF